MTVTFKPSAAFSDGAPVCALSVIDAVADLASGSDAYVTGSQFTAKWEPSVFRAAHKDNDTITGPVTVTWTWVRLEATVYDVDVVDGFGGASSLAPGGARTTSTTTTTVTAPDAGWAVLEELNDLVVNVAIGGGDESKVALVKAILTVNTVSSAAVGTPVVTIVHPPSAIARSVNPRVEWAFDHPSGYAQSDYQLRVFDGAPSPAPESDPAPLYDTGTAASEWGFHDIAEALDWTGGLRVYVRARSSGGSWSTWVYRTVTSEPHVVSPAPTVTAPNGAYTGDPVPPLTLSDLEPAFASSGLASVHVRGYYASATADPDVDDPDVDLHGEVTWGPNLHPDPSFDLAAATTVPVAAATVTTTSDWFRIPAGIPENLITLIRTLRAGASGLPPPVSKPREKLIRARTGARSLVVETGGGTDGATTYSGVDTPRTSHYLVSAWVWAPAGVDYDWGVRSVETDLTTVIDTATEAATGTGNWQRHQAAVCPGGAGDCRVGFHLTSAAATGTLLYVDDVEILAGTLPTLVCTEPLPSGLVTYWHCRATAQSGLTTGWGTSNTTPAYTGTPTASAATATVDTANHRVTLAVTRAAGYTGSTRLEVQRSDDAGTTWVDVYGSGTASWTLASTGSSLTLYDRAAPSLSTPSYRYRLVGYATSAQPKPHAWVALSATGGPLGGQNWLRDPADSTRDINVRLQVAGFALSATTDGDVKRALGAPYPVAAVTRASGQTITAAFALIGAAARTSLVTLVGSGRTLLLQAAFGGQWWVRPVGGAATVALLSKTRAATPVDIVTVTLVEVDQPEAT